VCLLADNNKLLRTDRLTTLLMRDYWHYKDSTKVTV